MSQLKIAMIQMDIATCDFEKNKYTVNKLLKNLKTEVDILIFPEMWSIGFDFKNMKQHGLKWYEPVDFLKEIATARKVTIIGGSIPEAIGNKLFNSTFVIDDNGIIKDRYWKMHLVSENNLEGTVFDKGDRVPRFQVKNIPFGIANCYDIRFPELFRGIAFNGSKIIFLVAQFPIPLYHHWITLLTARAIENQIYVVAVNRVGKNYFGHSVVISPKGEILYETDDSEGIHVIDIDIVEVDRIRNIRNDLLAINEFAYNKWVYPANFIGVGGLVERENKILLVKQNYGKLRDRWLLPGGHVDKGESLSAAVKREVLEETGVKANAREVLAVRSRLIESVTDCYIVFKMDYIEGEPQPDGFENTEAGFYSLNEIINKKDVTPLAVEIIKNYFDKKNNGLKEKTNFVHNRNDYELYI